MIEEVLGTVYDDEGIFNPEIVEELRKRAKDIHSIPEEELGRILEGLETKECWIERTRVSDHPPVICEVLV